MLKVAAGTLDASTKIYAVRVDAVHADAYRVLGGLGAETKPGDGGGPLRTGALASTSLLLERSSSCCAEAASGGADEEEAAGAEAVAKQPRRRRPPKRTVEQNLSNINSAESERRCEVRRREGLRPPPR